MSEGTPDAAKASNLPVLLITLLKGALYREHDSRLWSTLLSLQVQARDHVAVLGLDLMIDETEGYAFLRNKPQTQDSAEATPRLFARRQLPIYDSLLLALLRKKLAEFDAKSTESRLVLKAEEIHEMISLFLPERSDQVKLMQQVERSVQRLEEMGFLRKLKPSVEPAYEVARIIKAFVDAQWLGAMDEALESYKAHLAGTRNTTEIGSDDGNDGAL